MQEFVSANPKNGICPKGRSVWGPNVRGRSVGVVQMSAGVEMSRVEVSVGSKCHWGRNVGGVEVSLGLKCRRGQSVSGVEMGVNRRFLLN